MIDWHRAGADALARLPLASDPTVYAAACSPLGAKGHWIQVCLALIPLGMGVRMLAGCDSERNFAVTCGRS